MHNLWKDEIPEEKLDEVPEPQKEAYSKLGDIFLLGGKHRVMCGDSTKKEDVEKLMDGKKADVLTDPPYNKNFHYKKYNDNKSEDDFSHFCMKQISRKLRKKGAGYEAHGAESKAKGYSCKNLYGVVDYLYCCIVSLDCCCYAFFVDVFRIFGL